MDMPSFQPSIGTAQAKAILCHERRSQHLADALGTALQRAAVEEDDDRGVRRARRHQDVQRVLVVRVVDTVDIVDVPVGGHPGQAEVTIAIDAVDSQVGWIVRIRT